MQSHLSQLDSVCKVPFQNLIYTFGKIMKTSLLDHIMKGTLSPVCQHTFAFPFWLCLSIPSGGQESRIVGQESRTTAWKRYQSMFVSPCTTLSLVYFSVKQKQRDEHDEVLEADFGRCSWFIFVHV